ncbi:MAG: hypothetical protein JWN32_3191 [Solirubrobacterales bacterium]|nr:hypothetical protein [Solirubrobacterales bacterium]
MPESEAAQEEQEQEQEQRRRSERLLRLKIGWYTLPAVFLLALTAWLLVNMAGQSGSALVRVLLGIVIVLAAAVLVFKAVDRPTNLD